MRITGGQARGLRLAVTRGPGVRPTSSRVRGALFQLLGEAKGAKVLDLYAGTGALGIEALSRGAAWVDFVEQDVRLCRTIQQNLRAAGFAERGEVHRAHVEKALGSLQGPYDAVLMDPPYGTPGLDQVMQRLDGILARKGIVVLEHSKRDAAADVYGALRRKTQRRYGDTELSIYAREDD